jgi:signal transduction histidine kinase
MLARAGDGRTIKISVADRGGGFPDELLPRAFDRFSQGTDDGRADGAGLGLAIVAALAGALGGSAQAANRPGGGAIVTLTLRAA